MVRAKFWRWCEMYPNWRDGERERWEALRRQGKTRFVIKNGVVFWAGWCFLAAATSFLFAPVGANSIPLKAALTGLMVWSASGVLWGHLVWEGTARSYARYFGASAE